VTLFGRLREGVSMAAAQTESTALAGPLASQYPAANKSFVADIRSIAEITGVYNSRPIFVALWLAVGFVLLIACADVANMLLARGAGRAREISIRIAIGAGRARIVRQLLIESVLLAIAGGFLGWLVALGYLGWFDAATSSRVKPVWLHLHLDKTAFTYMAVVSIATGILFGLAPALRLAKIDVFNAIKDGGQGSGRGRRVASISNLLVVIEMTLCIVLLTGAGLMIRSTVNLYAAPIGVNATNVLTAQVNLPDAKYPLPEDEISFHRMLKRRLDSLPGVEASSVASNLPFGLWVGFSYELEGAPAEPGTWPQIGAIVTTPDYFRVMQVKIRRGRAFAESDGMTGPPVVMINESFARKYWPGENVIGKHIRLVKRQTPQPWLTVIGVLPDILQNSRRPLEHNPLIYLPYEQEPQRQVFIAARTRVPPGTLANALRREMQKIDPNLALYQVGSLENRLAEFRFEVGLLSGLFSVFAGIALVLASVGLYAVIAHSVSQRTQEIGVRMAVGGSRRDILRLVYAQGMRPLLIGMGLGVPAAMAIAHVLQRMLIGVSPGDPITLLAVVLALAAAGAAGCAIPARRAIRVDPIVALRYE
jgi:predicted permease